MNKYENRPLAEKSAWRHICFAVILIIPETVAGRQKVTIDHYYKDGVGLLESVLKKYKTRPLAEKSTWRHVWFAVIRIILETVADNRKVSLEH